MFVRAALLQKSSSCLLRLTNITSGNEGGAMIKLMKATTTSTTNTTAYCFSTATNNNNKDLVLLDIDQDAGIATLTMNRPPVNSLSLEM